MADTQVVATFTANTSAYVQNVNRAADATQRLTGSTQSVASNLNVMKIAAGSAIGALAVQGINKAVGVMKNLVGGSFQAAARVEELNVAMTAIGKSTGKGGDAIRKAAAEVKKMGIETATAQQVAIQFAQANLNMADASKVARVAQDLAVVAGLNSTDTTQRLIQAIITGNSELLRQAGIAQTAGQAYEQYAKETGKSAHTLTALEKQQAMTNMIMKEGEKVAGTYEASMESAGKVMRSFPRLFNDIQVAIGSVLSGAFGPLVLSLYQLVKYIAASVQANGAFAPALQVLKEIFISMVQPIKNVVDAMTGFLKDPEKMRALGQRLYEIMQTVKSLAPEIAIAVGALLAFSAAVPVIQGVERAIKAAAAGQKMFNIAALSNPYVLAAAAIVAAVAAIAIAFKYVYDRSAELRKAWDALTKQLQEITKVIFGTVIGTLKSLGVITEDATGKTQSFGDMVKQATDILSKIFVAAIKVVSKYYEFLANYTLMVIKYIESMIKIVRAVADILRVAFVAALKIARDKLVELLNNLGPVGEALKKMGTQIKNFFSAIPGYIAMAVKNIGPALETLINQAIKLANVLIDVHNAMPGVEDITPISDFKFGDFRMGEGTDPRITGPWAPGQSVDRFSDALDSYKEKAKDTSEIDPFAGADEGAKRAKKAIDALKAAIDQLMQFLDAAREGYKTIMELTDRGPFTLRGKPMESPITAAFGKAGDVQGAIAMYKQLSAAVDQYYNNMIKSAEKAKLRVEAANLRIQQSTEQNFLRTEVQNIINLMTDLEDANKALAYEERRHQDAINSINAEYDALIAGVQAQISAAEARWQKVIDGLQKQLDAANEVYQKENAILQSLIQARESFLKQISDGFRQFASEMALSEGDLLGNMQERLKQLRDYVANVKALASAGLNKDFLRQIIEAGPTGGGGMAAALVAGGADAISQVNALQEQLGAEIASFSEFASQQYYDLAIAQQTAIVEPLAASVAALQAQIESANISRANEIASMQAHIAALQAMRAAAIAEENAQYEKNRKDIEDRIAAIEKKLEEGALKIQEHMVALGLTLPGQMYSIGMAAVQGFVDALNSKEASDKVKAAAKGLADKAKEAMKITLEISSPSKVMESIGMQVADGLILGMERSIPLVEAAARNMALASIPGVPRIDYASAGSGTGSVTVSPGAVQVNITGSMDGMSADEIQRIVDQSLMNLAREIRRT